MFGIHVPRTDKTKVSRPAFLAIFAWNRASAPGAARTTWALDTTPSGHLRAGRALASLYNRILAPPQPCSQFGAGQNPT
jgi:hypothetical protein